MDRKMVLKERHRGNKIRIKVVKRLRKIRINKVDSDSEESYSDESYYSDFEEELESAEEDVELDFQEELTPEESEEENDVEMAENDESDMEMEVEGDEEESGELDQKKEKFQRTHWQYRLLPYHDELKKDADIYFSTVKTGLAHSIILRDFAKTFAYWLNELNQFLRIYSFRFTKTDHINLINLLYSVLTSEKLDFNLVKYVANTLFILISRKSLLNREDLQLDWRPLYNIYTEVAYKNLEEEGLVLMPNGLKKLLGQLIHECNHFFPDETTQEVLDEVRPFICPHDDIMMRGFNLLALFLPTALSAEQHDKFGAKLWFDELWHWFTNIFTPVGVHEKILSIFAGLARDCPGYINWSDKLDTVCSHVLHTFKLHVGMDNVCMDSSARIQNSIGTILVYSLGGPENAAQKQLDRMFQLFCTFLHPSNTGTHTANLQSFFYRITLNLTSRINRERYRSNKFRHKVPPELCITDEQIDVYVKSLLPCIRYAAFSKIKQDVVCSNIRLLAFLSPGLIIPFVLDIVYPALEVVKEPHRLLQSLQILATICVPLVRDDPTKSRGERVPVEFYEDPNSHLKSYRIHAISLLNNILPGLDVNDMIKSALTFQAIVLIASLIPIVDCSDAIHLRTDLSDEERELCSATASLTSFVDQLMDKAFAMLALLNDAHSAHHPTSVARKPKAQNIEEAIITRAVPGIFKLISMNCSTSMYMRVFEQFHNVLTQNVFYSEMAADAVSKCASSIVSNRPAHALPILLKFILGRLKGNEAHFVDEEIEPSVIFYLKLAADIVSDIPGTVLLANKTEIDEVMRLLLIFEKSKEAVNLTAKFCQNVLSSLCKVYHRPKNYHEQNDQPLEQYLPIRHWANTVDKNKLKLDWHIPSEPEIVYASQLIDHLVFNSLDTLLNDETLTDKQVLKLLTLVHSSLDGCSYLCPFPESEDDSREDYIPIVTPGIQHQTFIPTGIRELTKDGKNLRAAVYERLEKIGGFLLEKKENDTKSAIKFISILKVLFFVRGVDPEGYRLHYSSFCMSKKTLTDPIRANTYLLEIVFDGISAFLHPRLLLQRRPFATNTTPYIYIRCLKLLLRFGTSLYSAVRVEAQKVLCQTFIEMAAVYKPLLDDILEYLDGTKEYTHEQFKGALYILVNGKELSLCVRLDWTTISKIWLALCRAKYTEKPSILRLIDLLQNVVVDNFTSFQLAHTVPDSVIPFAMKLLQSYPACVHAPIWPTPDETQIEEARLRESQRNKTNISKYNQLTTDLLSLATNKKFHHRKIELANAYLSLLLRRDIDMADECIRHFFRLLVSDVIKTRKMAISLVTSWLKITKPKSLKFLHQIDELDPNNCPGAVWPIKYGYRKDNRMLLYDSIKQPTSEGEWDQTRFFFKHHWGFYTWPKEFKSYAPIVQQHGPNRDPSEFTKLEADILGIIGKNGFMEKFVRLFSIEEKKGHDKFDASNYGLFYRLFRNFNLAIFELIAPSLENLLKDKREGAQRLASEMVAGLITGSRLCYYRNLKKMLDWLIPRLEATLETINAEAEGNWGTCLATTYSLCDSRAVNWLTTMLFALIGKPSDNIYLIKSRLYLLHCALGQHVWKVPEHWRALAEHCVGLVDSPFKDIRYRAGSCLAMSTFCDIRGMYVDPTVAADYKILRMDDLIALYADQMAPLSKTALLAPGDANIEEPVDNGLNGLSNKREKLILATFLNTYYGFTAHSTYRMGQHLIALIPVLAHFANDTEEELANSCRDKLIRSMALSPVDPDDDAVIAQFFMMFEQVIQSARQWKTKTILLRFIQVFTVSNMFLPRKYAISERIRSLLLKFIADPQFDVRVMAADTFSGLLQCAMFSVDENLLNFAYGEAASVDPIKRHSGVLILAAVVQAYPYSVPSFLPDTLMALCKHVTDPSPIRETVKKVLNEFKRTHQDSWHEHRTEFSEEQLEILTNLMVSANYYV